jgi:hypothetical protein
LAHRSGAGETRGLEAGRRRNLRGRLPLRREFANENGNAHKVTVREKPLLAGNVRRAENQETFECYAAR